MEAAGDGQIKDFVGTGPFRFVERIPDRYTRLARFDRYAARAEAPTGYGGRRTAYVDEIQFIPVPNVSTRTAGVESGEFHFSDWIAPDAHDRLARNPRLDVMIVKPNEWISAIFNKRQGLFTSRPLRQAVLAALDDESALSPSHRMAADVNGDASVDEKDVHLILVAAANPDAILPAADRCESGWIFWPLPPDLPNQHPIEPEVTEQTCRPGAIAAEPQGGPTMEENFEAIQFGDCAGRSRDERAPPRPLVCRAPSAARFLRARNASASRGSAANARSYICSEPLRSLIW